MKLSASFASLSLAALLMLGASACAHADLIKQNATYTRTVLMTSASDHISPYTGAASTLSVQYAQAGGAMTTPSTAPTITAQGNGRFAITLTGAYTASLGALDLTVTASGADPSDTHDQIIGFDPASDLGAAALAQANTGITTANTGISNANTGITQANMTLTTTGAKVGGYAPGQDPATLLLAATLFPGLTLGTAFGDIWATDAGPSTATRPASTSQITVYTTPAGAGQHTTALTLNSAGQPVSRTVSHP